MSEVTSSVMLVGQRVGRGSINPYLTPADLVQQNRMLYKFLSKGRHVKPSAITCASWLVTVPAGTVFLLTIGEELVRAEVTTALTILADATNNIAYLVADRDTNGDIVIRIEVAPNASVPGNALKLGTANNNTWTDDTALDKSSLKKKYFTVNLKSLTSNFSAWVHVPSGGTVTQLSAVLDAQPSATVTVTGKIATVSMTGGAISIANSVTAGSRTLVNPTAANVVPTDGVVELTFAFGSNATAGTGTVTVEVSE